MFGSAICKCGGGPSALNLITGTLGVGQGTRSMDYIVMNNLFNIPGIPSVLTVNAFNNRSDLGKEPFTHTDCVAKRKRVTSPKEHSAQSQAKTACIPSLLSLPRSEEEATQENTEAKESVGLAAKADVTGIQAEGAGNTYFQGSPWKCSKGS